MLTSDIIIGFPGETEAEAMDTVSLINEVHFDALFTFIFSPRPGTPAAKPAAAQAPAAPQVEQGIPADVVAAIMAAIYSMGNGKYVLKAVRRGKNGWGKAGVNDTTAPF